MCYVYACGACQSGDHERCEIGYGDGKSFGGGHCVCRCRGRSEKKWMEDEKEAMAKRIQQLADHAVKKAEHPFIQVGEPLAKKFEKALKKSMCEDLPPGGYAYAGHENDFSEKPASFVTTPAFHPDNHDPEYLKEWERYQELLSKEPESKARMKAAFDKCDATMMEIKKELDKLEIGKKRIMTDSVDHMQFFGDVLSGKIKLSNQDDANVLTSWKVGGQDFYAYGVREVLNESKEA